MMKKFLIFVLVWVILFYCVGCRKTNNVNSSENSSYIGLNDIVVTEKEDFKIGISLAKKYDIPMSNVIEMLHEVGFYAVSPEGENEEALSEIVAEIKKNNMIVQSLHAPYMKADGLWNKEEVISAPAKSEIIEIIDVCAKYKIPILVMHVWIGFDYYSELGDLYYGVFDEIVEYAENDTVGFCWDSGHEMCYNHYSDLLKLYGDRLIMTHINDNLGVSDPNGTIVWTDDLHLLPFDGIADWNYNIERLNNSKKIDILNLEISRTSKPNRNENDVYRKISLLQYFEEAYKRGCEIANKYSN